MKEHNCSIRIHSRHHLELKSEYPLLKDDRKTKYLMNFYFFFPSQLNVTKKRIGIKRFIENIRIYTRFSTPGLSLKMLINKESNLSPLSRIRNFLEIPEIEQSRKKDILLYELQVLTNVYRAEIENTIDLIQTEIYKFNRNNMCGKRIDVFLKEMQSFLKDFRKLHGLFINPRVTDIQRTALAWADESISIITERGLNRLFSYTQELESPENLLKTYEAVTKRETDYRKSMNYQYYYQEDDSRSGERLAYRENILKKWSQSAMYMNNEDSRTPYRIGQIIAGIAAGVAMIFAVTVTIFAGRVFTQNSIPWILLIVFSYIFKDRIKEILRGKLKKLLPRITSDHLSLLYDLTMGRKVGVSRGYANFQKAGKAPENILKTRFKAPNPFRSILPEQDLIHYQRTIKLDSKVLTKNHSRLNSVTEIIRIHIVDWLREMDDPKDIFYRLENMKKLKIKGNRVYKVHLIMSLKRENHLEGEKISHYCIVLNKAGILRIDNIDEPFK